MQTVLVTGATGFVGSHALEALTARGDSTVIAACRDRSRLLPGFGGEVREGDLRDGDYLDRLLDGVDVVVHAMSWSALWGHGQASRRLYVEPTLRLIDKALERGVRRIVNISTTSAASPERSSDPMSEGIPRAYWPHLCNVIRIENYLRERADRGCAMVNMRLGLFAGRRYGLGLLPILLPRLRTHLVPWVDGGRTRLPITDGRDIGDALALAARVPGLEGYEAFNIVGPEVPTVREVIDFLHEEYGYPRPHFSVPFFVAYPFAWLMEQLDPFVPWEPLVTRSIVHLLEEVEADNRRAERRLGFRPYYHWKEAIQLQLEEMQVRQIVPMKMHCPLA